jgi:hypothetical protein
MVAPRYLPHAGGVKVHIYRLAAYLVGRGDGVDVLTHEPDRRPPREESVDGVTVRRFHVLAQCTVVSPPELVDRLQAVLHVGRVSPAHASGPWRPHGPVRSTRTCWRRDRRTGRRDLI